MRNFYYQIVTFGVRNSPQLVKAIVVARLTSVNAPFLFSPRPLAVSIVAESDRVGYRLRYRMEEKNGAETRLVLLFMPSERCLLQSSW